MKFERFSIKNFRNFKEVNINLENKNIVFGMNDIGKTNFLYAVRFLLDKDIRKKGFIDSDYYQKDIHNSIEIMLIIDIKDYEDNDDSKKLIAKMKGVLTSKSEKVYIKLKSDYDYSEEISYPKMYWGDSEDNLIELTSYGPIYPIDEVFKIIYINPLINLETVFKMNKRKIFDEIKSQDKDKDIKKEIEIISKNLNNKISELSLVEEFQKNITTHYKDLRKEEISIELKSEMEIKGYYNNLIPYIKKDNDSNHYPTSGDGRRKLLSYSILNFINAKDNYDKILIYLVEEPENSLHKTMQIALSKQLFSLKMYSYLFVSTHSSLIVSKMDNVNLIKMYSYNKVECSSYVYNVPEKYLSVKNKLNTDLSEAIFADKVLLVEGPSEKILFNKIMENINPDYEINGSYILCVDGIGFDLYVEILDNLKIKVIIKTDNDLRKSNKKDDLLSYELLGLNRVLKYIEKDKLENINIKSENKKDLLEEKKRIFKENEELIKELMQKKIFLSEIDLENDLYSVIKEELDEYINKKDVVAYLQNRKLYNMVELLDKIKKEDCEKIYNNNKFQCLRELIDG